jgi:aspartate/methionine/tyrosine aminotransferase
MPMCRTALNDSGEFCRRMLAETGIAAAPGVDFDPGHHFVRCSYCGNEEDMDEATERLSRWR